MGDATDFMTAFKDKLDAREASNFGRHQREQEQIQHRGASFGAQLPALNPGSRDDPEPLYPQEVVVDECPCPEGLLSTYYTDDPFGTFLAMIQNDDCRWCGISDGAVDEREEYELGISPDIDGEGTCGWYLAIDEGSIVLFKEWDGGNPLGVYSLGASTQEVYDSAPSGVSTPCA